MPAARAVLMIRPCAFGFNPETAATNAFQAPPAGDDAGAAARAAAEIDELASRLVAAGVEVALVEDDPDPPKPDAVFPNNWVSFHEDGTVVLYPMATPSRAVEVRLDVVERLAQRRGRPISRLIDLRKQAAPGRYLEGTGSLVIDRRQRLAFACVSVRTDPDLAREAADLLDLEPVLFEAIDAREVAVYHTNVVMSIAHEFAILCADAIPNLAERNEVRSRLTACGRDLVEITLAQMDDFAANVLELASADGETLLALSERARNAYRPEQLAILERHARLVSAPLDTIETLGGGSVRCTLAELL